MSAAPPEPSIANGYVAEHISRLLKSYHLLTGRDFEFSNVCDPLERARRIYQAPFFLASHDGAVDPVFNYGNLTAQSLFEMDWASFTATPSRFTAEEPDRAERARLLEAVSSRGFIDDYAGIRISRSGKRFRIESATVWNVLDDEGRPIGQAATFASWTPL
jgi:hypothetical protein